MLVLTRKQHEEIVIQADERITIKVLAVKGTAVRIGIEAPREMQIWRGEVKKEVREAA